MPHVFATIQNNDGFDKMSLFRSIATFGGWTLISRITGFFRDMVMANYLGAGMVADAFFVAFKLPNLFRSLFAEGAFTGAFVPIFSQKLVAGGKAQAVKFAAAAISVLVLVLGAFVLLMEWVMPWLVMLLAPGFAGDAGKIELAAFLSRITFPFLLLVSVVSFQSGILNSFGKFAAPAATPVILNFMMIASVWLFMPFINSPVYRIAVGVTLAGVMEVVWLNFFLRRENVKISLQYNLPRLLKDADIRTLFKRVAPGVLGAGVYQINMMVDTILVSLVGTGAISWLYYANRLQQLPLGVVGAAIGVALLPILSRQLKERDDEAARETQNKAVEYGALLSIPAAVAIIVLAHPIVNILFERGRFGALETAMTAQAVIAYSVSLPVYVMVKALTPNFFARGDTRTPVKYSIVVFAANLIFSLLLMKPFGHVGIAAATSLAAFVSCGQYIYGLKKRGFWLFSRGLAAYVAKVFFCSLIMGGVLAAGDYALDLASGNWLELSFRLKLFLFAGLCFFGVVTFCIMTKIMKVMDVTVLIGSLFGRKGSHA